jgi:hypothetical protein
MTLKNLKKVQNPKLSRTKKKLFLSSNLFFRQFKDEKKIPKWISSDRMGPVNTKINHIGS